jgi:hypothetical protein
LGKKLVNTVTQGDNPTVNVMGPDLTIAVHNDSGVAGAMRGQKDLTVLRMKVTADSQDVSTSVFAFGTDNESLHDFENFSLWVDTNGDGKVDRCLQQGFSSLYENNGVIFSDFGEFLIKNKTTVTVELHADVALNPPTNQLTMSLIFIAADEADTGWAAVVLNEKDNFPSSPIWYIY